MSDKTKVVEYELSRMRVNKKNNSSEGKVELERKMFSGQVFEGSNACAFY